ncbi:unnamed protein product [Leptosia nina]|uniref:E3 ubiquitin-protein ligase FANCL n=1 Tax=Leptosia nina TaxID=320188 RepID=A0AAV1K6A3_9NEOP
MNIMDNLFNVLKSDDFNTLPHLMKGLNTLFEAVEANQSGPLKADLLDPQFLSELESVPENVDISFGKSLTDIKCLIRDENLRVHEVYLKYDGIKRIRIISVNIPFAPFLEYIYSTVEEVIVAYLKHVITLQSYFYELENIDNNCVVVEPIKPTFKDDYRNIRIDDKTWLHVEITPDGYPTNIHLIGQSETWQDKLQAGVLNWDHDKNIVENVMSIFDFDKSMLLSKGNTNKLDHEDTQMDDGILCGICFCSELPNSPGVPQPLCQNSNCNVYFHQNCLFQWLVACEGGRPPAFGVINGSCPTCLQPISCSKKDCVI